MPIVLVTGLPGHGKTLYSLWRWKQEAEKDGRKVYHNGIKGLNIPGWEVCEPEKWQDLPDGSLVIIDECQKCFPVRGRDRPPPYVEMMAEHRHRGFDFVLITQNPMQFDGYVRRLVDRHYHVARQFGTHWATIHEFTNGCHESVGKSRAGAIRHEWRYPKEVFDWYKSSEVHTIKVRIPARVWLLVILPLVVLALGWFAWSRMSPDAVAEASGLSDSRQPGPAVGRSGPIGAGGRPSSSSSSSTPSLSPGEFVASHQPRIEGLPHTAPRFDELTAPVRAPLPIACMAGKGRCTCYSQQATRMQVPDALCRSIVADGFFVDFEDADARQHRERQAGQAPQVAQVQRVDQVPGQGWQPVTARDLAQ